ncbi:tyrosine-type recombinase/integrase [Actinoplanes sp. NPDC049681]|uniref:tyrosine-type recombinase/integrase n=1 Tax=Actinoplanes sp. NPDC049681 TaxID=3363905 RepID=UPI0037B6EB31
MVGFDRVCIIDQILTDSLPLGLGHLQFEALLTTARLSANRNDFARSRCFVFSGSASSKPAARTSPTSAKSMGHRVLKVRGKGDKTVLTPLPPAVACAIEHAIEGQAQGPILRDTVGRRMDRHAATRRLQQLSDTAGIRMPRMHPHVLRHPFVTTMLDAGVSLRDVQIAARHADPKPRCATTVPAKPRPAPQRHPSASMASGT